jgi:hypothetical protein
MRVQRNQFNSPTDVSYTLLEENGQPIDVVSGFMRHLRARGFSPNTLSAYAYDLLHFMTFLGERHLTYEEFSPLQAAAFLEYLSMLPSRRQARRFGLVLSTTTTSGTSSTRLSPATVNRIIATVSTFYEYLILSGQWTACENPIQQVDDLHLTRVSERHRPFMGYVIRQRPVRRAVRMKTVQRVPRPMDEDQIGQLLGSLKLRRDKAMHLLMLHGGPDPFPCAACPRSSLLGRAARSQCACPRFGPGHDPVVWHPRKLCHLARFDNAVTLLWLSLPFFSSDSLASLSGASWPFCLASPHLLHVSLLISLDLPFLTSGTSCSGIFRSPPAALALQHARCASHGQLGANPKLDAEKA